MPNDQGRKNDEALSPNSSFVLLSSFVLRHSSFRRGATTSLKHNLDLLGLSTGKSGPVRAGAIRAGRSSEHPRAFRFKPRSRSGREFGCFVASELASPAALSIAPPRSE